MPQQKQAPKKAKRSTGKKISMTTLYVISVLCVSLLLATFLWIAANDVLALNKPEHSATIVLPEDYFTIKTKTDKDGNITTTYNAHIGKVIRLLKKNDLIDFGSLFRLFCTATNSEQKLRPGAYLLNTEMDYRSLVAGMGPRSDSRVVVEVTIPEGYTLAQTFQLLEEKGVANAQALTEHAANYNYKFSFLQDIPLGDANRLEGFLFPDTYEFYVNHDPKYVINKMLQTFDANYTQDMRDLVKNSQYSLRDYLTIASMIERESDGTDRKKIASVIFNRLQNPSSGTNGYLQVDATLFYITGKAPTAEDKAIDSPYNTYKYRGLPPSPIANPGIAALKAALNPEKTNYFYYALGDDGKHSFFTTYSSMLSWMNTQNLYKN